MRVAIDARMRRSTGIGRYVSALLQQVPQLDPTIEYVALVRREDAASWTPTANVTPVVADWPVYSWREQLLLPPLLRRVDADLVHFPHFNVPLLHRGRRVVTIHDLTLLSFRNGSGLALTMKQRVMDHVVERAVRQSSVVITVSAHVRDEIATRYRGVDRAAIVVSPNAVPALIAGEAPIERFGLGDRFLLYVGTFYPYKNVDAVVAALARLTGAHPDVRLALVGETDAFAARVRQAARAAGVADRVVFTGFVTDAELASLYRRAALFVFPSRSEGFGLPGIEAMAHDLPVVAARASCLPEVYGTAAAWFDPSDPDDLAAVIARVLASDDERARLVDAGRRRVASLSWERTAHQTLAAYRRALGLAPVASGR